MKSVKELHDAIWGLEKELYEAVQDEFPVGTRTTYYHGNLERHVIVVDRHKDRLRVMGATGLKYWINVSRFLE